MKFLQYFPNRRMFIRVIFISFYFSFSSVITESDSVNWCRNKPDTLTELLLKKTVNNKQNYRNVKSI